MPETNNHSEAQNAQSSIKKLLDGELCSRSLISAVTSARLVDGCEANEKHRVFSDCMGEYRDSMESLVGDAVHFYQRVVVKQPELLRLADPCRLIARKVIKELIRPAVAITSAWLYWVLASDELFRLVMPLSLESYIGRPFDLPEWWMMENVSTDDVVCTEQSQMRGLLKLHLRGELVKAAVDINIAKLDTQSPEPKQNGIKKARVGRPKDDPAINARAIEIQKRDGLNWPQLAKAMATEGHHKTPDGWRSAVTRAKRSK